jgi:hypothetical protein
MIAVSLNGIYRGPQLGRGEVGWTKNGVERRQQIYHPTPWAGHLVMNAMAIVFEPTP